MLGQNAALEYVDISLNIRKDFVKGSYIITLSFNVRFSLIFDI